MFSSAVSSVNKTSAASTSSVVAGVNKRPAKCDTDPTIQGSAVCRR